VIYSVVSGQYLNTVPTSGGVFQFLFNIKTKVQACYSKKQINMIKNEM